ncbi:S-adenosylmethionine:tRNA ribosyltransferase-isomerase [Jiulongibacter sediminis]|jgi:S-adenosylmethionine:tRNA ribosyltransferase-isomerase|uniref:S-adenosylmethionine:tRNA ribosyltransferase-isomerase n=1 Tax=Jiulongibacter sediminis TaxID=1605367 RepID=UPI0026F3521D|nr:S-adenosylmethionine:tRNA ribosyltransferase-isomerase [Jiulongibacter sediminis]
MLSPIHIEDYNYELPDDKIAKYPVEPRDSSKLLLLKNGEISSETFSNLVTELPPKAHLVFNNTKVIPARLYFRKETGALIEIFLLNPVSFGGEISQNMETFGPVVWQCMIGNKKKWKTGALRREFEIEGQSLEVSSEITDTEKNLIRFKWSGNEITFASLVKAFGEIPLPPYLNRSTEDKDLETYQTVYSEKEGAVAAPTAGLHFTKKTFAELSKAKIPTSYITLHVGAGTFQPVKAGNALEHDMHSEQIVFNKEFIEKLIENHEMVIPVGTTSMRSLESLYWFGVKLLKENENFVFQIPKLYPYQWGNQTLPEPKEALQAIDKFLEEKQIKQLTGSTEIFIFPGYQFRICKGIITNFHQPKSTLLLLISTLIGEKWKEVYDFALHNKFRFLSYGDSSLLLP